MRLLGWLCLKIDALKCWSVGQHWFVRHDDDTFYCSYCLKVVRRGTAEWEFYK